MEVKAYVNAVALCLVFVSVLFGLHQYQARNRKWGLKFIFLVVSATLVLGVGWQFERALLPAWVCGGFIVAYGFGWRGLGSMVSGWKRHLIRTVAFAICLGPLAGIPGRDLLYVSYWLRMLVRLPARDIAWTVICGLPGLCLVGAVTFIASLVTMTIAERRLPTRAVKRLTALLVVSLLPLLNWYAAGLYVHHAASEGQDGLLRYTLFSRPGAVDLRNYVGATPLHCAARWARTDTVKLLLVAGADAKAELYFGVTVLHLAAQGGQVATLRVLLSAGAGANATDMDGFTPLHYAVRDGGHADAVKTLVEGGACVNVKTNDGTTPLQLAGFRDGAEEIRLLLAAGARVNERNVNGRTALDVAQNDECRGLLRQAGGKTGAELDAEQAKPAPDAGTPAAPAK